MAVSNHEVTTLEVFLACGGLLPNSPLKLRALRYYQKRIFSMLFLNANIFS